MYEYRCIVKKVVDGDTVDIDIDLGFGVWLNDQRVRLIGIDAPETRTRDLEEKEEGYKAKRFVESFLGEGTEQILISKEFKGKFGRILGDFKINDRTLTQRLLEEGLVEVY